MASRTPGFAAPPPPTAARRLPWAWLCAVALLSLGLLLQLVLADRARLARDAQWRPTLEAVCGALGCALPPWHEPAAFRITSREVGPHPGAPGALLITASFRNDARWPQAWPMLEVALHDLDGQALGLRRFQPVEYLGSPPAAARIAPGQSAVATLEILDPGKRAVAFTFDFH
jgi:hypothetical protein